MKLGFAVPDLEEPALLACRSMITGAGVIIGSATAAPRASIMAIALHAAATWRRIFATRSGG